MGPKLIIDSHVIQAAATDMANIKSAAGFFADYLRHLGLFAAMLLLILLACSLKGKHT